MIISQGADLRQSRYRRELFLRFYEWSLRHRSFPGGVHYALPYVAREMELDADQRTWLAFLNGNTQNPVTSLLLLQAAPRPEDAAEAVAFWARYYRHLNWDTDRRYHKAKFAEAVQAYTQLRRWDAKAWNGRSWDGCWQLANEVPYMGRLSAWSYLEYLRILGLDVPDADTLLLEDISGSRSHRNGLCLVTGRDEWVSDKQIGSRDTSIVYPPELLQELADDGRALLKETRQRMDIRTVRTPVARAFGNLSLESALCTFKSWHKRNRRYPGVYNDLLHDRIIYGEINFGHRFGLLWDARRQALPGHLLLEDNKLDPGCVPVKQNWFIDHGEVINMTQEWPEFANGFEVLVAAGEFGQRAKRWI